MRALLIVALFPLLAAAQGAPPYIRSTTDGNVCLFWHDRSFVYSVDSAGNAENPGGVFQAIDAAYATWQTLSNLCSDMQFTAGARLNNPVIGYDQANPNDNTNALTFRQTNCLDVVPDDDPCFDDNSCGNKYQCWNYGDDTIALTTTTFDTVTGAILDADTEFNAAPQSDGTSFLFTTVDSPPCDPDNLAPTCVATDVQNTLTHEIGHQMGFAHVLSDTSTMDPTAPIGETRKRIIDSGTAEGFCDVYPRGLPATSCDATAQERLRVDGVQALGCNAAPGTAFAALCFAAGLLGVARRRLR